MIDLEPVMLGRWSHRRGARAVRLSDGLRTIWTVMGFMLVCLYRWCVRRCVDINYTGMIQEVLVQYVRLEGNMHDTCVCSSKKMTQILT